MAEQDKQEVRSTGEQVYVTCKSCGHPQHVHGAAAGGRENIACAGPECKETFSIKEGIKHAIVSDNDFLAWGFISDTMISGRASITIGTAKEVAINTPVRAIKKVFITPAYPEQLACEAYFEPKILPPNRLVIVTCGDKDSLGVQCEIRWVIYADVLSERKEPWREYLQRSKESLVNEDYQSAVVEAEIAVEVTIAAVLWDLLVEHKHLSPEVVEWILSKVQAASERLKRVMELAIDKPISDISPAIYKNWARSVADKRNRIVHQGEQATKEEASDAIAAAFEIIWLLLELVDKAPVQL